MRSLLPFLLLVALASPVTARAAERPAPPAWAGDAVWYQIFPERFRNGDQRNDPTRDDVVGSWPHDPYPDDWRIAPWTADWYKLQPWERANGRDFYYNVQRRRYGGDIQGIMDRLDYLQDLGVTAIYLNPIFESPSLHKYDATFYHHVDNNFGPDPSGDRAIWAKEDPADPATWQWTAADRLFLALVAEVHKRKMRIVVDGVFNHAGMTFWALDDIRRTGRSSRYADWFTIKQFDDPTTPASELAYVGWAGVPELPEFREENGTLMPGPREHFRHIVRRWMDPNGDGDPSDGIDGWRLDVAEMVGHDFWREFRSWVLEINPNAYLTGEVWWEDWSKNRMFNAEPWLRGDQFDAVMNYRFADAAKAFFVDRRRAIGARELDRRLAKIREDYRPETGYALMNLMDSHDTDRLASMTVNPDRLFDHAISPKDDPAYEVRAPRADERLRHRLVAIFQFTYLGAPMVYYGTETGMWGPDDPDPRKPMVWSEMKFENEATHPLGKQRPSDPVRFDASLHGLYRTLGRMRARYPELRRGAFETLVTDDSRRVYGFVRTLDGRRVVALFNASERAADVRVPATEASLVSLLDGRRFTPRRGVLRVRVPRLGAVVLAPS